MAPSVALRAYSRALSALFDAPTPAQTTADGLAVIEPPTHARGAQPVWYHRVVYQHSGYYAALVDWQQGTARLFDDASDAINGVPSLIVHELPDIESPDADTCVRETFRFLLRGHSWFDTRCRCNPFSAHIGIAPSAQKCPCDTDGQPRTIAAIERELGLRSLYGEVCAGGETLPLLDVLVRFGGLTLVNDALSSPICCVPRVISTRVDLENAARVLWPSPYIWDGRPTFPTTATTTTLRIVRARQLGKWAVFWNEPYMHLETPVDTDVRALYDADAAARRRFASAY